MLSTPSAGDVLHKPWDWMDVGEDGRREGQSKANSNFVSLKHRRGGQKQAERYIYQDGDFQQMNRGLEEKWSIREIGRSFSGGGKDPGLLSFKDR